MTPVLALGQFSSEALKKLATHSFHVMQKDQLNFEPSLANTEALIIRSTTQIDQGLLNQFPKLKFIVTATSGTDHIDFSACENSKVVVKDCPDANVMSVAEHLFWLLLELVKHPRLNDKCPWRQSHRRGSELYQKTLGVIGLGRIGSRVASMAQSFGMNVIANDPYIDSEEFVRKKVEPVGLSELLRLSDFVSLHVPLTKETRGLINHRTLDLMTDESYLINTSRGAVVKESDLVLALQNKSIKGAALDVFESEPLSSSSVLKTFPNLILSPHSAAFTQEAFQRSSLEAVMKLIEYFEK